MAEMKDNPFTFCWTDLLTGDVGKAREFYTEVFGWRTETMRLPGGNGEYVMFKKGDLDVAGLVKFPREGIPAMWLPYLAVEDVDQTVNAAERAGAEIVERPQDVPSASGGKGRFAVLRDPTGAIIALWKK